MATSRLYVPVVVLCTLAAFWCESCSVSATVQAPPGQSEATPILNVRLSAQRNVILPGEDLELRVEIWNKDSSDVLVCKDFDQPASPLCRVTLLLQDETGTYSSQYGLAADLNPWKKKTPSEVLTRDWIALRPGHFYGSIVQMDVASYPRLRVPGAHRVLADYSSAGLVSAYLGALSADADELAHIGAKSWHGEVSSNYVDFQVASKH